MGKRLADEPIEEGQELISGDRHEEYGEAIQNFTDIVAGWNVIINIAMETYGRLMPFHVCLMMDWLKTCPYRTPDKKDSYSDKVGCWVLLTSVQLRGRHNRNN